jgi:phosphatidylserine synthase
METVEPVRRTLEIEEVTNLYFIHPIASRLTPLFAAMRIPPNAVSVAGMLFGILAGVAYYHYQDLRCVIAGFILMIAWHVMDGADGQLARLTQSQSQFGKVLDGICDYVTFIAVYTGLAVSLTRQYGNWIWGLVIAAGMCHAVQAAAYEVQRQEYNFWGLGRKSAEFLEPTAVSQDANPSPVRRLSDFLHRVYVKVQLLAAGVTVEFHKRLALTLELQPERAASLRQRYREAFAPSVRRWSVMSANYRTLGIFICAVLGAPQYYFWFEVVGFNVILVLLLYKRHARYALFFESLESVSEQPVGAIDARGGRDKTLEPLTTARAPMRQPLGLGRAADSDGLRSVGSARIRCRRPRRS